MTARERLGLIGMGTAAAIASAAAVYFFDRPSANAALEPAATASVEPSNIETGSIAPARTTPKSARLQVAALEPDGSAEPDRLTYVPGEADMLRASYAPEPTVGENPDDWNAETATEAAWQPETQAGTDWQTDTDVARQSANPSAKPESAPRKPVTSASTAASAAHPKGPSLPEASLKERLEQISPAAKKRIKDKFEAANAAWPPEDITLIAIKEKKVVELYARPRGGAWQHIHKYPVLAASGVAGPKLRQGDKQVPEGVYNVSFLNPNSRYHVSMRLNYPNEFDREMAAKDGRKELGGDIMIHGKAASIGCLAMGDEAAEELFVLAAETGLPHVKVIIAPTDFRRDSVPATAEPGQPHWLPKLYTQVASAMSEFPKPPGSGLLSFFEN